MIVSVKATITQRVVDWGEEVGSGAPRRHRYPCMPLGPAVNDDNNNDSDYELSHVYLANWAVNLYPVRCNTCAGKRCYKGLALKPSNPPFSNYSNERSSLNLRPIVLSPSSLSLK
jgi:hypothetical protein